MTEPAQPQTPRESSGSSAALAARCAELETELRDRVAEVETLHAELRVLAADLEVKDAFLAELKNQVARLHGDLHNFERARIVIRRVPFLRTAVRTYMRRTRS